MKRTFLCSALMLACSLAAFAADKAPQVRENLLVSTDWLAEHLSDPNLVILHVARNRERYDKEHIPGAHYLAWSDVAVERNGIANEMPDEEALTQLAQRLGIDEKSRIVLYDEEAGISASRGYVAMDVMGLGERAALLDGQFKKWVNEKRPVTSEEPQAEPSTYQPQFDHNKIATFASMKELIDKKRKSPTEAVIIDARSEAQYSGKEPGEGLKRGGHIPGADNVFCMNNVESPENPVFKPAEELQKMYGTAGVEAEKPVVTYCRTGGQASLTYFVLKYLGYEPQMYDGSFSEWSAKADVEVE